MDSTIRLSVGPLEIDWGKNCHFADHGELFQPCGLAQVPYCYVDENDPYSEGAGANEYNVVTVMKDGQSKPLKQAMERIDLLGYTMNHARREIEYVSRLNGFDSIKFRFEQLPEALATVDVTSIAVSSGEGTSTWSIHL